MQYESYWIYSEQCKTNQITIFVKCGMLQQFLLTFPKGMIAEFTLIRQYIYLNMEITGFPYVKSW